MYVCIRSYFASGLHGICPAHSRHAEVHVSPISVPKGGSIMHTTSQSHPNLHSRTKEIDLARSRKAAMHETLTHNYITGFGVSHTELRPDASYS